MSNHLKQLKAHSKTSGHVASVKAYKDGEGERIRMANYIANDAGKKIVVMEMILCSFIADNNLPLSLMDALVDMLRVLFPKDPSVIGLRMAKQKASNIIRNGMHS